jgi:hypothetical protein
LQPYTAPSFEAEAFHCPHCGAFAFQSWTPLGKATHIGALADWHSVACRHCNKPSMWLGLQMVYPATGTAPQPNPDLPDDIRRDYEEARAILSRSPRGAAALLRLAVQKLCKLLGEPGRNLNGDIGSLVNKGLLPAVKQALDAVRVIGNNAVHPGQIDLNDTPQIAAALFRLVNLIAEQLITAPKQAEEIYGFLPESDREAIAKRDA